MVYLLAALLFLAGLFFPPGSLDGGLASLCATIFGLIAAGIFPAISLLISAPVPASFSVQRIENLNRANERLVLRLLSSLGCILVGGLCLLASTFELPLMPIPGFAAETVGPYWQEWFANFAERAVQAVTFAALMITLDRLRVVAGTFLHVRQLRFEMAVVEAKGRQADAGANASASVERNFATSTEFGRSVRLGSGGGN